MQESEYIEWVRQLPKLTPTQLNDVKARFRLLDQVSVVIANRGKKEFGDRVTQAICDVLSRLGVEHPSQSVLRKSSAYAASREKFDNLASFLEAASPHRLVQDQLLKKAIELLYFDLVQWQGIAISAHTVLSQIHRIPATLNKHFPGYAASGLLLKIVKTE